MGMGMRKHSGTVVSHSEREALTLHMASVRLRLWTKDSIVSTEAFLVKSVLLAPKDKSKGQIKVTYCYQQWWLVILELEEYIKMARIARIFRVYEIWHVGYIYIYRWPYFYGISCDEDYHSFDQ